MAAAVAARPGRRRAVIRDDSSSSASDAADATLSPVKPSLSGPSDDELGTPRSGKRSSPRLRTRQPVAAEDSGSDFDAPAATRRRVGPKTATKVDNSSDSDYDVPLSGRKKASVASRRARPATRRPVVQESEDGEDDSEDDGSDGDFDAPIASRRRTASRKSLAEDSSDEDFDAPLSGRKNAVKLKGRPRAKKEESLLVGGDNDDDDNDSDEDFDEPLTGRKKSKVAPKRKVSAGASKKKASGVAKKKKLKRATKKKKTVGKAAPKIKKEPGKTEDGIGRTKFEMPGQRRPTPAENEPLRLFYESMYHEKAKKKTGSDLAEGWMMTHGLLDKDTAAKVFARRKKAKLDLTQGT